jgi:transcription initiation factor TFIIB
MMTSSVYELSPGEVREEAIETTQEPWRENLNVKLICQECQEDPPNLVEEASAGDVVCGSCGTVLDSNIVDMRSEWRNFANDDQGNDDPSRVGQAANPLLDGPGLSSEIQFDQKSSLARELSRAQSKINDDKGNRQLVDSYNKIQNICNIKEWPRTISDTAKQLYKLTTESRAFRSKNQEAVIAGVIFIACRQADNARTFKEITKLTRVPKKEIGRMFKHLETYFKQRKKNTKGAQDIGGYKNTNATAAYALCDRFGAAMGLPNAISIMAGESAQLLMSTGLLAGRSPLSVAAVGLYAISNFMGIPKSAKDVGKACNVSDGTIKAAWKKIYEHRMRVIKPEWVEERGGVVDQLPAA